MKLPTKYLQPGEILVGKEPCLIKTILGSCVSVCLFDPVTRIGGMNHYLFPEAGGKKDSLNKYGDQAILNLLSKMEQLGARVFTLEAKICGGAKLFDSENEIFDTGRKNSHIASEILRKRRITILLEDVGGNVGRSICFNTFNGDLQVKQLDS
jgi:chemotaxis protein CheD